MRREGLLIQCEGQLFLAFNGWPELARANLLRDSPLMDWLVLPLYWSELRAEERNGLLLSDVLLGLQLPTALLFPSLDSKKYSETIPKEFV